MNISTEADTRCSFAPPPIRHCADLAISDIFAALIEDRRYKPTMSRAEAYEILCGMRGKLEGPLVVAFKEVALNR
jgi:hypothetical protein